MLPFYPRSTSCYCVFFGDNLLSSSSKRHNTLFRSIFEPEYMGFANAISETIWLQNLLSELLSPLLSVTLVYYDNVSAIYLSA